MITILDGDELEVFVIDENDPDLEDFKIPYILIELNRSQSFTMSFYSKEKHD